MSSLADTVIVNSKNRTSTSSSTTDFEIKLDNPIEGDFYLEYAIIPNNVYTVNSADDTNKIYFYENSTNKTASITPGYYSESSFPAAIKSALDTASGGFATYTVTISSSTKIMTITSTQNFGLRFSTDEGASRRMGYSRSNTATNTTSHTGSGVIYLSLPNIFLININQATHAVSVPPHFASSFYVPADSLFGEIIYYNGKDSFREQIVKLNRTNALNVKLRNEDNQAVSINGGDVILVLRKSC